MTTLERMAFPSKCRMWVYFCISTVGFSVWFIGKAMGFFPSTRGLRQGDPLSPLLFIWVMEILSRLIIKANEVEFLEGTHINSSHLEDVLISHFLFVNDTLIFCKPYLSCILVFFEVMSGLIVKCYHSHW